MQKKQKLTALNKKMVRECTCALREDAKQAVLGDGNANADILFIGEAPGKKEDLLGTPFVGASGKFLSEMLASIQLDRKDIYITNIVKYRPPNNRDPLPSEIEACKEWLHEEIKIIQPKIIVTLGRHAMMHFAPEKKISSAHGTILQKTFPDIGTHTFYFLYHPAAALYNGSMRNTLIKDFKKIPQILEKIKD